MVNCLPGKSNKTISPSQGDASESVLDLYREGTMNESPTHTFHAKAASSHVIDIHTPTK